MAPKIRLPHSSKRASPHYPLRDVKALAAKGKYQINVNASLSASEDFEWEDPDILDAIGKLQLKHFHKSEMSIAKKGAMLDFYKARGLKGEDVYTHFYIDGESGKLVINSFKELEDL